MRPANTAPPQPPSSDAGDGPPLRLGRFIPSQATPLVVDGRMFLSTPYGRVVALDSETGRELWVYELPNHDQPSTRGVEYWPGGDGAEPAIFFGTRSGKVFASADEGDHWREVLDGLPPVVSVKTAIV